jgi:glycosyltransferase involved in cell wall biosynthesis
MTGILIVSYNRPEYYRKCLDSFKVAIIPDETLVMLIDDASTDPETIALFNDFQTGSMPVIKLRNQANKKISANIKTGFDYLFLMGCDIVMNFDSDSVIKPYAIVKLIAEKQKHKGNILTGFNCTTRNADGSERHKIIDTKEDYHLKKSVGGLNMVLHWDNYNQWVLPALVKAIAAGGNWDHVACINSESHGKAIVSIFPSVVQHIGIQSSMGHSSEAPDVADDFNPKLKLPDVTLFGIDSLDYNRLLKAAEISQRGIEFGDVVMLKEPNIKSKEEYSRFMIKELYKYVRTSHVLVIQWDGYVLNPAAWEDEFLNYSYSGATWCFKSGGNVGNGGFSLRSRNLCEVLAKDESITDVHPEDAVISRQYRPYLEKKYGIKFAPEEVANRFAIEAYGSHDKKYAGQFGFHGFNVDYTGATLEHIPKEPAKTKPLTTNRVGFMRTTNRV